MAAIKVAAGTSDLPGPRRQFGNQSAWCRWPHLIVTASLATLVLWRVTQGSGGLYAMPSMQAWKQKHLSCDCCINSSFFSKLIYPYLVGLLCTWGVFAFIKMTFSQTSKIDATNHSVVLIDTLEMRRLAFAQHYINTNHNDLGNSNSRINQHSNRLIIS